jgi:TIR domain
MGVFICWSGENSRSHKLAEILRVRIPEILQTSDPFVSAGDIGAGEAWMGRLTKALEEKRFGILCITPENKDSLWIHFEAGALWKADESRRVCPLLYDIRPAELTGPLTQLQYKQFDQNGFLALMKEVNKHGCSIEIPEELLERTFKNVWPKIEADVSDIKVPVATPKKSRPTEAMIEEILQIVRSLQRTEQEEKAKVSADILARAIEFVRRPVVTPWPTSWEETQRQLDQIATGKREYELATKLISAAKNIDAGLSEALRNGKVALIVGDTAIFDFPAFHRGSFEAVRDSQFREVLRNAVSPISVKMNCGDNVFEL